jgi:hypothetical protein
MAGAGLLDKLSWKSEPGSESDSEMGPESESLSDVESELDSEYIEPDPAPKRSRKAPKAEAPKVTAAAKREARETLEALVELPVTLWARRDPTCAAVAAEQQGEIVDAFMALVVKRPAWLAALTDLGNSGDWIRMIKALYPVVMVVIAHHVSRTIGDQEGAEDDLSGYHAPRLAG